MAMNCMKKLLLSGSAAPRMVGSFSGLWMMLCTCWKNVLPMVPYKQHTCTASTNTPNAN